MLRIIIVIIIQIIASILQGYAQVRMVTIDLGKNEEVIEIINLGKNGFIIETVDVGNYNFMLKHYSRTIEKEWEAPMPLLSPNFKTSISFQTDYLYITNQTLQINLKNQTIRKLEVADLPPGRVFRSYFQDIRYWYGMFYVKYNDTYMMRRLEHKTGKLKDIVFQLPKGPEYKYSTEWYYISNDNSNIYVYNKTTGFQNMSHLRNDKLNYEIINLDTSCTIKNRFNIDIYLDSIYVCPSLNFRKEHEFPSPATDFEIKTKGLKDLYVPKPEAYSSIVYEPNKKNFYIYGLWGTDPFFEMENKSQVKGYFIFRYDIKGNPIDTIISRLPNDTSIFAGYDVKTLFSFTPDNKLLFQICFDKISTTRLKVKGLVYSYVYYEGRLFNSYINYIQSDKRKNTDPMTYDFVIQNIQHFDFILTSSNFSGPVNYYNTLSPQMQRQNNYRLYNYENSSVLIEEEPSKKDINLYLFNK